MPRKRAVFVIPHQLRLPLSWMDEVFIRVGKGDTVTAFVESAARDALAKYGRLTPRPSGRPRETGVFVHPKLTPLIDRERTIEKPVDVLYLELSGLIVRDIRELVGRYNTGHFLRLAVRARLGID